MANESFRIPRGILQLSRSSLRSPAWEKQACRACRIYKSPRVPPILALLKATNFVIADLAGTAGEGAGNLSAALIRHNPFV